MINRKTYYIFILFIVVCFRTNSYSQTFQINYNDLLLPGMVEVSCDNRFLQEGIDFSINYENKTLLLINGANINYEKCDFLINIKKEGIYTYSIITRFDYISMAAWQLASIPKYQDDLFLEAKYENCLKSNNYE